MVSFRNIIIAAAACAVPALAALTPKQMITNIQIVTQKSQALQGPAQSINLINGPLIVVGLGPFPQLIAGFSDIVSTVTVAISQMQGSAPVAAGADADGIYDAFREFVRVHQVLLNILIGKAGLFETVPLIGQPVAAVLRQVESVVDTIALSIIDNVQSRSKDLQSQASSLDMTLTTCINAYSGIDTANLKRADGPISRAERAMVAVPY